MHRLILAVCAGVLLMSPAVLAQGRRPSRQDLLKQFDTSNPQIDLDDLRPGGPRKDGIPALTKPERMPARHASYPKDNARVIEVAVGDQAVAYPIWILNWHEIINDTVGGVPVAVTYCPLCDSAAVMDRRLTPKPDADPIVLEFGVSGFLLNSNVVMYERNTDALWSQVYMQAITGPHAGRSLKYLPARVVSFKDFKARHPHGEVLTKNTGYDRPYDGPAYERYFADPDRVFYKFDYDDRLPPKTLGMGIKAGDLVVFVRADAAIEKPITVETPLGRVVVTANEFGLQLEKAPEGVSSIQTFYHSWSAFYPKTTIIPEPEAKPDDDG